MAFLITLEGGDGSGKGSVARSLVKTLKDDGFDVEHFREPGTGEIAEEIRKVILKPRNIDVNHVTEALLYSASRAQFVSEVLEPAMETDSIIIQERFYDSTTAYQGYARGVDLELIKILNKHASKGIKPDLTLILDVTPDTGLRRCQRDEFGGKGDRLEQESLEFHEKIREGYLKIAEENSARVMVVDAENNDLNQVVELVIEIVRKRLEER